MTWATSSDKESSPSGRRTRLLYLRGHGIRALRQPPNTHRSRHNVFHSSIYAGHGPQLTEGRGREGEFAHQQTGPAICQERLGGPDGSSPYYSRSPSPASVTRLPSQNATLPSYSFIYPSEMPEIEGVGPARFHSEPNGRVFPPAITRTCAASEPILYIGRAMPANKT